MSESADNFKSAEKQHHLCAFCTFCFYPQKALHFTVWTPFLLQKNVLKEITETFQMSFAELGMRRWGNADKNVAGST